VFLRLDPVNNADSAQRFAVRSRTFDISGSYLKATMKGVAEQLVGILMSQKEAIEKAIGGREQKKGKTSK